MNLQTVEATRSGTAVAAVVVGRRNIAKPLVAAGGTAILLALGSLGMGALLHGSDSSSITAVAASAAARVVTSEISVTTAYAPGESSGWHLHPMNHSVQVLSGTLVVYDGFCQASFYGPGETYVGGTQPHLARNEGEAPVEMIVTTSEPSVAANSVTHLAAPTGCSVA